MRNRLTISFIINVAIFTLVGSLYFINDDLGPKTSYLALIIPAITFLILFFQEVKHRIKQNENYNVVMSYCLKFSFWSGALFPLPFFLLLGFGPDGPMRHNYSTEIIYFLVGLPISCAMSGCFVVLIGIVLLNQFYDSLGGKSPKDE